MRDCRPQDRSTMSSDRYPRQYLQGATYGLAAVGIWSGWIVVARLGLRTSLTPWDIAALRFGVAGVLLLPYVFRRGLAIDRLLYLRRTTLNRRSKSFRSIACPRYRSVLDIKRYRNASPSHRITQKHSGRVYRVPGRIHTRRLKLCGCRHR